MRAIAVARRRQVIEARRQGMPAREVAGAAQVSERTVRRFVVRWQETGSVAPRHSPGRPRRIPASATEDVDAMILANPTASLATRCHLWQQQTEQTVSTTTMSRTLTRCGWVKRRILRRDGGPPPAHPRFPDTL